LLSCSLAFSFLFACLLSRSLSHPSILSSLPCVGCGQVHVGLEALPSVRAIVRSLSAQCVLLRLPSLVFPHSSRLALRPLPYKTFMLILCYPYVIFIYNQHC
jgi:hypothetical protein